MAEHSKNPNATKRGPGRYHSDGHQKADFKQRRNGRTAESAGAYGRGLDNNTTRKQAAAQIERRARQAAARRTRVAA